MSIECGPIEHLVRDNLTLSVNASDNRQTRQALMTQLLLDFVLSLKRKGWVDLPASPSALEQLGVVVTKLERDKLVFGLIPDPNITQARKLMAASLGIEYEGEADLPTFGSLLRLARKERGWSQQMAAFRLAYDQSFVAKLENGNRKPTPDVLRNVLVKFGFSDISNEAK